MEQRIIKFRAWDDRRNVMITSFDSIDHPWGIQYQFIHGEKGLYVSAQTMSGDWYPVKLLQFTGHHDKKSNEIYEGDLWQRDGFIGVIVFEFGAWQIKKHESSKNYQYPAFHSNAATGEVIGNIYQS